MLSYDANAHRDLAQNQQAIWMQCVWINLKRNNEWRCQVCMSFHGQQAFCTPVVYFTPPGNARIGETLYTLSARCIHLHITYNINKYWLEKSLYPCACKQRMQAPLIKQQIGSGSSAHPTTSHRHQLISYKNLDIIIIIVNNPCAMCSKW